MSINSVFQVKPNRPTRKLLTVAKQDIFTPVAQGADYFLLGIRLTNVDASNTVRVKLYWQDSAANDILFWNDIVAVDDAHPLIDDPFVISTTGAVRKLVAEAQSDSDVHCTVYTGIMGAAAQKQSQ